MKKRNVANLKRQEKCHHTKLYGALTTIFDDDDEVYVLHVISLCSLFGFVSLHGSLLLKCAVRLPYYRLKLCEYSICTSFLLSFVSVIQLKISF